MAESSKYSAPNSRESIRASVVFPVPGGPQKISENGWLDAIALVSILFLQIKEVWPVKSDST